MEKVKRVNHVVLTLKVSPHGLGMERDEVDAMVNRLLEEGYDTVDVYPIKGNLDERQQTTDLVQLYVFKAYEKETATKSKKADG